MSKMRVVNELSLLTGVYVELERLKINVDAVRDGLVEKPDEYHYEVNEALQNCRIIMRELQSIKSLMRGADAVRRRAEFEAMMEYPEPEPPQPEPPKGPPGLKLVS